MINASPIVCTDGRGSAHNRVHVYLHLTARGRTVYLRADYRVNHSVSGSLLNAADTTTRVLSSSYQLLTQPVFEAATRALGRELNARLAREGGSFDENGVRRPPYPVIGYPELISSINRHAARYLPGVGRVPRAVINAWQALVDSYYGGEA